MSRKALIVVAVIGLVVVITGLIFFFGKKTLETSPEAQEVTITQPSELSGWRLINHQSFELTVAVPPAWEVVVFDEPEGGKGSIRADYLSEGVSASMFVNRYKTSDMPSAVIIRERRATNRKNIERNSVIGISYETKETQGDYPEGDFIENSYILVNQYSLDDETVEVSCHLLGSNYRTLISTCQGIFNSIQFTQ